ncbi:MAG: hypothetical protein ACI87E_001501 [Mariniblastus sp.]|jgi:hypothetical protein
MVVEKLPSVGASFEHLWPNVFDDPVVAWVLSPVGWFESWLGLDEERMELGEWFSFRLCHELVAQRFFCVHFRWGAARNLSLPISDSWDDRLACIKYQGASDTIGQSPRENCGNPCFLRVELSLGHATPAASAAMSIYFEAVLDKLSFEICLLGRKIGR